ncbi:uncharacterized protein [Palaemon carinicauda]|uniref:uncharacterized protein n=1 Tax=Palaemon carinicauda TaxID=392227 RepID=UPI0035B5CE64
MWCKACHTPMPAIEQLSTYSRKHLASLSALFMHMSKLFFPFKYQSTKWLKREVEVLERSEMYRKISQLLGLMVEMRKERIFNSKEGRDNLYTFSTLHSISSSEGSNCIFCKKLNHKSVRCHKFLALDGQQRYKIRELGVCVKCLNRGHISKGCKVRCAKCQGGYNVVMCGIKLNMTPQTNVEMCGIKLNMAPKQIDTKCLHDTQLVPLINSDHMAPPSASMLSAHYSNKTVLQTAKVKIMNNKGGFVTAELLLDSGCDRSYVSSKLTEICKPEWVTRTEAPYSSFGGHSSGKDIESDIYKLNVLDNKSKIIPICAASIPKICIPLVRLVVPTYILDAFSHLGLADDFDDSSPVELDILIGVDYYWSLINPKDAIQVGKTVAMSSVFGWVSSGEILAKGKLGITSKECKEDIRENVVQEFEDKIDFLNGRYEVQLPWKNISINDSLMSNGNQAMKRLNKLLVRFDKDEDLKMHI